MATIDIWLFGKPEWEIDLDKATPKDLRCLGDNLKERLYRISEIVEKLEGNEWRKSGGMYRLFIYKDISRTDAKKELEKLGIRESGVHIDDFAEDDGDNEFLHREEREIMGE